MANKQVHSFNVKMTADQFTMLNQLATDTGLRMSDIVRTAVSNHFQQRYANVPKCANNNACLCPQMHHLQNVPKFTDAELIAQVQSGANE